MTEESLVLGRPPEPPRRGGGRRGRWAGRGPGIVVGLALAGLAGWAVWHGAVDDGSRPSQHRPWPATTARPPAATRGGPAPAVPYLRNGMLVRPSVPAVGLPAAAWTDFVVLTDGRLVLTQQQSVTVLGRGRARSYLLSDGPPRGMSARPDGTAVAWTGPDGRVRRLAAGDARPVVLLGTRQLVPACRGLTADRGERPEWMTCDREGRLYSPGGAWSARIGDVSISLLPRLDPGGGTSVAFLGVVDDAVWEDPGHLLVVVRLGDEARLLRVGTDGSSQDVIAPLRGADTDRPPLVLPAIADPAGMQP